MPKREKVYTGINTFRMKPLPKSEYYLMKSLLEQYSLDDPSELFSILLRMAYKFKLIQNRSGQFLQEWFLLEINEWRALNKTDERDYSND